MRFAWQRKNAQGSEKSKKGVSHPLNIVMAVYNIIWWIPMILPFTKLIDYQTGFMAFFIVTVIRLIANVIRNNVLKSERAEYFPLRSP